MAEADMLKRTASESETTLKNDEAQSLSSIGEEENNSSMDIEGQNNDGILPAMAFHEAKWLRYRKRYNDKYLDLFHRTHDIQPETSKTNLKDSQIGAVQWTAREKEMFFAALARHGRHNLHHISTAVGSKSQIEVKEYLDTLQQAFVDRQLYLKDTKNVSHSEIEAAVEIGPHHEGALNHAADALSAFQEHYDVASGQQRLGSRPWIINRIVAEQIEASYQEEEDDNKEADEEQEQDARDSDEEVADAGRDSNAMFRLVCWLDLSEKLFMNRPADDACQDWSQLAEDGQTPALTQEAVNDFHDLAVSLTQRVLQVAIFMAKSRIRSTSTSYQLPARNLTRADVRAALDVLNMPCDSWEFWKYFARRNGLQVLSGRKHDRNADIKKISLTEAERHLSKMSAKRQASRSTSRGRSMSVTSTTSLESLTDSYDTVESRSLASDTESEAHVDSDSMSDEVEDSSTPEELNVNAQQPPIDGKKRKLILEEAEDDYMERIDRLARQQEERSLSQFLKNPEPRSIKNENDELGVRPKTLRKDKQDLHGWSCSYMAEWELFGELVPEESFIDHRTKRLKQIPTELPVDE